MPAVVTMTAAPQPSRRRLEEQLIGAVIPAPLPRPAPPPAPMPALPAALPAAREPVDDVVFDVARPDADGRVAARALLRALRWPSGHRLHIDVTDGLLLITARPDGMPHQSPDPSTCAVRMPAQQWRRVERVLDNVVNVEAENGDPQGLVDAGVQILREGWRQTSGWTPETTGSTGRPHDDQEVTAAT